MTDVQRAREALTRSLRRSREGHWIKVEVTAWVVAIANQLLTAHDMNTLPEPRVGIDGYYPTIMHAVTVAEYCMQLIEDGTYHKREDYEPYATKLLQSSHII